MTVLTSPPARSRDQRMHALDRANDIRIRRAQMKRDVRAGHTSTVGLLLDPPWWLLNAKVMELLLATPKVGQVKAGGMLNRCRVSLAKTVGGMTPRQREELALVLRARGVR